MESSASLLAFVLAGAFLFLYLCHYTGYLASRMEGRQLVFLVGAVAVGLLFLSRFLFLVGEVALPEAAQSFVGGRGQTSSPRSTCPRSPLSSALSCSAPFSS